jgi:hypothetical protein
LNLISLVSTEKVKKFSVHFFNRSQVFDPLANVLKGLKHQKWFVGVNRVVNSDGGGQRKSRCDESRFRQAAGGKRKEMVELEDPNVGAGYILPLLHHVVGELKSILDGDVLLETCRPLAFYVFHGLLERFDYFFFEKKCFILPGFCLSLSIVSFVNFPTK